MAITITLSPAMAAHLQYVLNQNTQRIDDNIAFIDADDLQALWRDERDADQACLSLIDAALKNPRT